MSIVIPSHSRVDLLDRCLRSVLRGMPAGTEVIVVDDASIGRAVSRTASRYPNVRVERLSRNGGFCVAANRGIAMASGNVIELLNDDVEVTPGWAEAAMPHFDNASIGAVAPLVLMSRGRDQCPRIDSAGDDYDLGGFARKRGHGEPLSPAFLRRCEVFGASGSSGFYRGSALRDVGVFPEHFGSYFEDVDLAWRLSSAGYRTIFEPGSVVWHRVSASYGTRSRELIQRQSRNEELVFMRNVSGHWPRHAAVLAAKAFRRFREGNLLPWALGRARAWADVRSG